MNIKNEFDVLNNYQYWFINPMPQQTILNEFHSTQSEYVVPGGYISTQDTHVYKSIYASRSQ